VSLKRHQRKSQHRPEAEEKKKNKQLADAKREVHQLRRKIARLQKQVEHEISMGPYIEPDEPQPESTITVTPIAGCTKCGHPIKTVYLSHNRKTLSVCQGCGAKELK
jgi:hypothetical protein